MHIALTYGAITLLKLNQHGFVFSNVKHNHSSFLRFKMKNKSSITGTSFTHVSHVFSVYDEAH